MVGTEKKEPGWKERKIKNSQSKEEKKKLSMGGWCMGGRKNKTEQG